jgi:hypothetical protein
MPNPTLIFHTTPIRTFQLCLGVLLCSLSLAAQAVQPQTTQLDIFSLQLTRTSTQQFSGYQLSTTIANATASSFVFSKALRLPTLSELKKGALWTTSIRWNYANDGIQSSLSPRLRIESKESRIELNPFKRTVSMTWRRELS